MINYKALFHSCFQLGETVYKMAPTTKIETEAVPHKAGKRLLGDASEGTVVEAAKSVNEPKKKRRKTKTDKSPPEPSTDTKEPPVKGEKKRYIMFMGGFPFNSTSKDITEFFKELGRCLEAICMLL